MPDRETFRSPRPTPIDRAPWRLDPAISFLNHGSFGACPGPVLDAQRAWRDRLESEPVRFLARDLEGLLDEARREVASFLGADADGLAFVPNATTGVNAVLASLRFRPGDELLTTDHEYNATLNALRLAAERDGATVVRAEIPFPIRDPSDAVDAILAKVTPKTRFAMVSHVTSATALVLPIEAIVRELDRRGIDTLVDGAHAPGMVPVDLDAIGAAFWTGNGHKWLCGPKGAAMLHVRSDRRQRIRPLVTSHGENDPRTSRSRFHLLWDWLGTGDPTPYLTLPAAIRFVGALDRDGWQGLMASNVALARTGRDRPRRHPRCPAAGARSDARRDGRDALAVGPGRGGGRGASTAAVRRGGHRGAHRSLARPRGSWRGNVRADDAHPHLGAAVCPGRGVRASGIRARGTPDPLAAATGSQGP